MFRALPLFELFQFVMCQGLVHAASRANQRWRFCQKFWWCVVSDLAVDLQELAAPISRDDKIMDVIKRAARRAGLPTWRAFNIWYGKTRVVKQEEREAIAVALHHKRIKDAANEFHELKTRLAILESRIARVDEDFHREDASQIRQQIRGLGGRNRT